MSVAAVSLRERVDLKRRHEALVVPFTDCPPAHDSAVVVEPLIMSERECLESSSSSVLQKIIVARTLATWYAADGSVPVHIANPSPYGVAPVSYTHLRAHETRHDLVCRLLLEKKK